jgi:paraquat-inducible protein B
LAEPEAPSPPPPAHKIERRAARTVRRRFSLIWLLPIIAALASGWLGWRTWNARGPTVTLTFLSAEGLEAGKTKIKHKDVELGHVESVEPTPDLSHVVVRARMSRVAAAHLTTGTRFWIVRPRLSAEGVSGLGTLISGAYIELDPGQGDATYEFTGLEVPPIVRADEPGRTFTLRATQLGSIGQGAPVYFRGIKVGEVLGYDLSDEDGSATVRIFVRAPHEQLVHTGTRFWNASGVTVSTGGDTLKLEVESIQSLLSGGVAFDVPPGADMGEIAGPNVPFTLYPNASLARDAIYTRKVPFLLHFSGAVQGLTPGSPVRMKGIRVGSVTDVHIEYDGDTGKVSVPVAIDLEPERVQLMNVDTMSSNFDQRAYDSFRKLVAGGLRARLATGNLLTGQKVINLDFLPNPPPAILADGGKYPELPTVDADDIDTILHSAKELLAGLNTTVDGLNRVVTAPEVMQSVRSLHRSLDNLDRLTKDASADFGPLLQSLRTVADSADNTMKQASSTLATAKTALGDRADGGGDLAGTLRELKAAARSARMLADYLESHPEALVRGKAGEATK